MPKIDAYKDSTAYVGRMYDRCRRSSIKRGHPEPSFSLEELRAWALNQPDYQNIYDAWISAGRPQEIVPSIDRLNDYEPYSLSNIRITTWEKNRSKAYKHRKDGTNCKVNKPVIQLDKQGKFVAYHHSVAHASRSTQTNRGSITSALQRRRNTAGGYQWRYLLFIM